ncbi:hypothetical protein GCM10007276_03680 [Agaricicola taiwanensis]|uniref:DUF1330 domain-containing protein n=1 Tax=Agaricicola taiwanensis TaxID=591372 RepID=A0A8J2VLC0_9RHOB|nr:DUF1330 domain-containing protein [Agaricicola taiwanensis]GGE29728.1 hypothetical protein GCM10007276_03680 [Agaricicola taiwanensis]
MSTPPKGYWIARVDISDEEAYRTYTAANGEAFAKYSGRFLVRGGRHEAVEGKARSRNVIIEFPTYEAALACWRSDEYRRARSFRDGAATAEVIVIEGYEPS